MSAARTSATPAASRSESAFAFTPALADLRRKYEHLIELRRRRDARKEAGPDADRVHLRALASEFPGCLRELDACALGDLEARLAAVVRALEGERCPPWLAWMDGYHRLFGAALAVRARLPKGQSAPAAVSAEALAEARERAGLPLDEGFLAEVARPPAGRLALVVLARLARLFAVPADEIASALFPIRRPSPYSLAP